MAKTTNKLPSILEVDDVLNAPHVSVYRRKGKWYFNTKSKAYESEEEASMAADRYAKLQREPKK